MRTLVQRLVIFIACLSGAVLHAIELRGQPQTATTADSATIQWKTDVECGTKVQYGLSPTALERKAEGAVTREHSLRLEGLKPATTYYFSVGSARAKLATGSFTTAGGTEGGAAPATAAVPQPSLLRRVLDVITPDKKPAAPATTMPTTKAPTTAGAAPMQAPPTRQTWGHMDSFQDHFDRHGQDFASTSLDDYAAKAWSLLQRARAGNLPMKLDDTDGTLRVFDPATGAFAAYNGAGKTKTFFKPDNPNYWQRQPGRAVKPNDVRFFSR